MGIDRTGERNSQLGIHNLGFEEVLRLIEQNVKENESLAIISIKPGFFPVGPDGFEVQRVVERLVPSMGLRIICTSERSLSEEDVRKLYDALLTEEPDPPEWLVALRAELLEYLPSSDIFSYLVAGPFASEGTHRIKQAFRERHLRKGGFKNDVRNIIHASDPNELELNLDVYFGDRDDTI